MTTLRLPPRSRSSRRDENVDRYLPGATLWYQSPLLAAALATGCARVDIGTAPLGQPDRVRSVIARKGEKLAVGLDVSATMPSARGWPREGGELFRPTGRARRRRVCPLHRYRRALRWRVHTAGICTSATAWDLAAWLRPFFPVLQAHDDEARTCRVL